MYFFTMGDASFYRQKGGGRRGRPVPPANQKSRAACGKATARLVSGLDQPTLTAFLYTRLRATGWNSMPVTLGLIISALHWVYSG